MLRAMMGKKKGFVVTPTYYLGLRWNPSVTISVYINGILYFEKTATSSESGTCPTVKLKIGDVISVSGGINVYIEIDDVSYGESYNYGIEHTMDKECSTMHFGCYLMDPQP